ncbi:MAG: hypothetical protein VX938_01505, partial [Myxococcota bacterium]|nr:hypothetical protein [Myxococcota bacterium]
VSVDCCSDGNPAEPETVASDAGNPFFVGADHAHVYWTDFPGHSIRRAPGEGGEAEMLEEIMGSPRCLTLNDTHVYWTSQTDGLIQGLPKTMDTGPITLSTILGWPEMIAVSETHAFWADKYTGAVRSVPLDGSEEPAIVSANGGWTFGLDVDEQYVYWSDDFTDEIIRANHDGSEQMVLAQGQTSPFRLEVQGDHVFWIEISAGAVLAVHRDGGDPLVLAAEQDHIWGLATDETYVYWTQGGDGSVSRVPHGAEPVDGTNSSEDGGGDDGDGTTTPSPPQPCPPDVCDDGHFCTEGLCEEDGGCVYVASPACGAGTCSDPLAFSVGPGQPTVELTVDATTLTPTTFPDLCNPPPGAVEHTLAITLTSPGDLSLLVANDASGPDQHEISVRLGCAAESTLVSPCAGPGLLGTLEAGTYLVVLQQWLPPEAAIQNQTWDFTWSIQWSPPESQ